MDTNSSDETEINIQEWSAIAATGFAKDWNNEQDAIYDNWEEHYKDKPMRVRVENGKLIPLEPIHIPDGTILLLKIIPHEEIDRPIVQAATSTSPCPARRARSVS